MTFAQFFSIMLWSLSSQPKLCSAQLQCLVLSPGHLHLKQKIMHHARLGDLWIWCRLVISYYRNRYIDETWCDEEWDEEGAHARRLSCSWTNAWITSSSEWKRHIHMHHQAKTNTIEYHTHFVMRRWRHVTPGAHHHSIEQQLDTDTTINQCMSAVSCQVVSEFPYAATSILWAMNIVNQMYCKVEVQWMHMNMKSHVSWKFIGIWTIMRVVKGSQWVSITPWLYILPHCMNKGLLTLAPPWSCAQN